MTEEMEIELSEVLDKAEAFKVTSLAEAETSSTLLQQLGDMKRSILAELEPTCKKTHEAWKAAVALRDRHVKPIDDKMDLVKLAVAKYHDAERRRQHAELEAARIKAEVEEMETREAEAETLRQEGADEKAVTNLLQAPIVTVVPLPAPAPKVQGIATGDKYDFVIVDEKLIPRQYMMVNEVAIRAAVRSQKELCTIPGIQVVKSTTVRSTGKKK